MALLGNHSVLHKSPLRFVNGREALLRSNFNKHGMVRNAYERFDDTAAIPNGHLSPSAWVLAKTAGGMSSHNIAGLTIETAGLAVGGITTNGTASITFTLADADGQLISSGEGTALMTFTVADALLTASIGGTGTAAFDIGATGLLGALASGEGSASMTITFANAQAYPLNDSSPLRDGSASFAITGSLVPYAIGSMAGSTADTGVLTSSSIAGAVWSAASISNNEAGTMGNKLNSAASGGVDYSALATAVWANMTRTLTSGAAPSTQDIAAAVWAHTQ